MQYAAVMAVTHPAAPLKNSAHIMERGSVYAASLSSSDMWTDASAPSRGTTQACMPINADTPGLFHPGSWNVAQAKSDVERGDKTHRGTKMQKMP